MLGSCIVQRPLLELKTVLLQDVLFFAGEVQSIKGKSSSVVSAAVVVSGAPWLSPRSKVGVSFRLCLQSSSKQVVSLAGIIESLVDAAYEKDDSARTAIFKSVVDIGRRKHVTVLTICHGYLQKHSKVR